MGASYLDTLRYETLPRVKEIPSNIYSNLGDSTTEKTAGVARFTISAVSVTAAIYSFSALRDFIGFTTLVLVAGGVVVMLFEVPSPGQIHRAEDMVDKPAMIDNQGYFLGKTPIFAVGSGILFGSVTGTVIQLISSYRMGQLLIGRGLTNVSRTIVRFNRLSCCTMLGFIMAGRCPPRQPEKKQEDLSRE